MNDTQSLGLRLVRSLTNQLGGRLQMSRTGGTEYIIEFTD
jgi:two-component sensor histidine kinase